MMRHERLSHPLPQVVLTSLRYMSDYPPATAGGTDSVTRVVLTSLSILIGVSIACSAYKSAGSEPLANDNLQAQPSASTNTAAAQEKSPCTLTLAGAPDIKGIKLGMTPEQVLALFPGSNEDADLRSRLSQPPSPFGVSDFVVRPDKYQSKDKFAEVTQITFTLLDGRVSTFSVG